MNGSVTTQTAKQMEELPSQALLMGVALPLAAAMVLTGAIRFALGRTVGANLAAAAIGGTFLITYAALNGWPEFPPRSGSQILPYVVLFGLVLGTVIDLLRLPMLTRGLVYVWPAVIVGWIGWRQLNTLDVVPLLTLAALWLGGVIAMLGLDRPPGPATAAPVMLLAASVGAAVIAFVGAAASQAQFLGVLAAAIGGFLLWNWPVARFAFGSAAVMAGGGAFIAIAGVIVLFSEASQLAMVFILPVFLAGKAVRGTQIGTRPMLGPIVIGCIGLAPVVVAIGLAVILGE